MSVRPSDPDKIERLRHICLALREATEKLSHGEPSWFVGGKQFVTTADHHHDDRLSAWLAAPEGAQQMLVQADPQRFFRPPYVGVRGWLGIYLDVEVDWVEVGIMVEQAYRQVAPKRLLTQTAAPQSATGGRRATPGTGRPRRR